MYIKKINDILRMLEHEVAYARMSCKATLSKKKAIIKAFVTARGLIINVMTDAIDAQELNELLKILEVFSKISKFTYHIAKVDDEFFDEIVNNTIYETELIVKED